MADYRMANRADFKAEAGITALSVRVSPRWQRDTRIKRSFGETVKVTYADGRTENKTAASFRKSDSEPRIRQHVQRSSARIAETARITLRGMDWSQ